MAKKKILPEEVKKISDLVKLNLSDQEVGTFSEMFSETLDVIQVLDELDTANVPETYQVNGLTNVFQKDDENKATLSKDDALKNAPDTARGLIATHAVFDRGLSA
jgi:aspartyl-tRNA(Asn)/glutamyl-tRNA(Gln) amidotransferase subunit C